jgi:hypothetical protein
VPRFALSLFASGWYKVVSIMRLKNYRQGLLKRLKDRKFASEYLKQTFASGDREAFFIALKDVIDASSRRPRKI